MKYCKAAWPVLGLMLFTLAGLAQTTTAIEGDVKSEDGSPLKGGVIQIERKDIKGHYTCKTDKKGHYYYGGLPIGIYKVSLEVDGKQRDYADNIHTSLGDPKEVPFDMKEVAQKQQALAKAADKGELTKDQERGLTAEQKAQLEKATKERAASMAKNKELNEAFNAGVEAQNAKQYDVAVQQFVKASTVDPNQTVVWAHLADAYVGASATKTGAEHDDLLNKALETFQKAIALKPDDAAFHNNYALALAKAKKFDDAQTELGKAATIDPQNAGKYYFNLGALLVNNGQTGPAEEAFKKAIDSQPDYADAYFQYGISLLAKAKTGDDGKTIPVPGTKEAFEKYLQLKPDGPNAATAKAMIDSMSTTLDTAYQNPAAKKTKKK